MNANQKCMITILTDHDHPLTTTQVLKYTNDYPELCKGCSDGSAVISAGMELVKLGKVERNIAKGGFVWSLKNQK